MCIEKPTQWKCPDDEHALKESVLDHGPISGF